MALDFFVFYLLDVDLVDVLFNTCSGKCGKRRYVVRDFVAPIAPTVTLNLACRRFDTRVSREHFIYGCDEVRIAAVYVIDVHICLEHVFIHGGLILNSNVQSSMVLGSQERSVRVKLIV